MKKKLFLIVLTILLLTPTVSVLADDGDEPEEGSLEARIEECRAWYYGVEEDGSDGVREELGGLDTACMDMYYNIIVPSGGLNTYLQIDTATDEFALRTVHRVYHALEFVAILLLIVYFLMDMSRIMVIQGQEFTAKSLAGSLVKLAIGMLIITEGWDLIINILMMNNWLLSLMETSSTGTNETLETLKRICDMVQSWGIMECIGMIVTLAFVQLGAVAGGLIVTYQAISRKLELYLRGCFAPVAIADCYEGVHSSGFRYIKKIIAIILWGGAMMIIVELNSSLSTGYMANLFESGVEGLTSFSALAGLILFPLATGGMCGAAKQICNDALGV